jgi:magnesium-transporting ATPase (P-type)
MAFLLMPSIQAHFRSTPNRLCHLTAFFALFIFTSVFNCFNARSDRLRVFSGIGKNRAFLAVMALVGTVQILFVYLGGSVLRTMPLTASELKYTLLLSLLVFPADLIRKLLWRCFGHSSGF